MASLKDLKGDELKQAQDRLLKRIDELWKEHDEAYQRFRSFVVKGNAGGVIATLSFLGALLGKGGGKPEDVVTVLIFFIIGSVGAGAGTFFEVLMVGERKQAFQRALSASADVEAILTARADPRLYRRWRFGQVISLTFAVVALLVGVTLGVRQLTLLP